MRIIGGRHRGLILQGPRGAGIRPTSDRARESLFNILEHGRFTTAGCSPLPGAHVIDAFCGTGALGLEALSRGAAHASFLDQDPDALQVARDNARRLGDEARAVFIPGDVLHPPKSNQPCSLAFLDPPYGSGLAPAALAALADSGWLAPDAIAVVESGANEKPGPIQGFTAQDQRRYGRAVLAFYRFLST